MQSPMSFRFPARRSTAHVLEPAQRPTFRAALLPALLPALLTGLAATGASAQGWAFVGARYQGMGGAGVAVVDDEHASYWNPGALAFTESYGVALPVGVSAAAEGSTLADIDRVSEYLDEIGGSALDDIIDDLEAGNDLDPQQLAIALRLAAQELPALDDGDDAIVAGIDASLLLRYRNFALTGIGESRFAADVFFDRANLAVSDLDGDQAIDTLVDPVTAMDRYAPGDEPALVAQLEALFVGAGSGAPNLQAEELVWQAEQAGANVDDARVASNIVAIAEATIDPHATTFADNRSGTFIRGVAIEQVGFGYGHPFLNKRVGLGGNVKYMMGTTFNKFLRYDDIDAVGDLTDALTDSDHREITHTGSLDLGLMVRPYEWLRAGVTARDVTRPEFDLARDPGSPSGKDSIRLDPRVRAGVALWVLPSWVVAFDADLTKNESPIVDGLESRIVSLGTEWKIPVWKLGLALRGGAYLDTAAEDLESIALTAGLGLRILDFNLDLAVGASPTTSKVSAVGDEKIPSRANASLTFAFRRSF